MSPLRVLANIALMVAIFVVVVVGIQEIFGIELPRWFK